MEEDTWCSSHRDLVCLVPEKWGNFHSKEAERDLSLRTQSSQETVSIVTESQTQGSLYSPDVFLLHQGIGVPYESVLFHLLNLECSGFSLSPKWGGTGQTCPYLHSSQSWAILALEIVNFFALGKYDNNFAQLCFKLFIIVIIIMYLYMCVFVCTHTEIRWHWDSDLSFYHKF